MTEEKNIAGGSQGNFVICDSQTEYSENLFQIFMRRYPGEYQYHIFHNPHILKMFSQKTDIKILLISEEYGEDKIREIKAGKTFIISESARTAEERFVGDKNITYIFRYQSAGKIMEKILQREEVPPKKERPRIRDEPAVKGIIGVYSPVHRIGKSKFALRLGRQMAAKAPALYLNLEGCAGGSYYFPHPPAFDMGDLLYYVRQNDTGQGMKISSMTGQINGLDYILPMKNEVDFRSVKVDEWISLLDTIKKKCIYECIILDLGDSVSGLYDILRKCSRIYTPYIEEEPSAAKMDQYETSLKEAGYGDILAHTVKRKMKKSRCAEDKSGGCHEEDRTAV